MTHDEEDNKVLALMLADAPDALLIAELEKRGYTVTDGQLPFSWADKDSGEEALSA